MSKIIAICGKICSGKTYYASRLQKEEKAVLLSCDELTMALFDNALGEAHDAMARRIRAYLREKAAELIAVGCTVILDWGFWTRAERTAMTQFCQERSMDYEWHYMDVDEETWQRQIAERNDRVQRGQGGCAYYLDDGLRRKLLSMWEEPRPEEIDVWHTVERNVE